MTAFLADESVQALIVEALRRTRRDLHRRVREPADDGGLDRANAGRRILITNDKDFAELMFLQRKLTRGSCCSG